MVKNCTAWQELQFGVFRFSVALFVPEIERGNYIGKFLVFFSFLARNGLEFLVSREESKTEKNPTHREE